MSLSMSRPEREAFLAETRVGILSLAEEGRAPLALPIWFGYAPGGPLTFVIAGNSKKAELLRATGRASFCVQVETPPYRYVSVEGPARISDGDTLPLEREMAHRYLGEEMGERYLAATAADRERVPNVVVTLAPERWITVDYGKMPF